MIVGKVIYS